MVAGARFTASLVALVVSVGCGGKQVDTADNGGQTVYLYVHGDVLFFVSASTTTIAEGILNGLP